MDEKFKDNVLKLLDLRSGQRDSSANVQYVHQDTRLGSNGPKGKDYGLSRVLLDQSEFWLDHQSWLGEWCGEDGLRFSRFDRLDVVPALAPFRTYAGRSGTRLENPGPQGKLGFPDFPPITEIDSVNFGSHNKIAVRNNAGKTTPATTTPMANAYANATVLEKIENLDATFRHKKCNETNL
ncbi:hypothetical protein F2Q70_00029287 [Brassica cretica]|uniref:Uncharacterized protein n=1 Tax=Brassica cretica TaxID=69181 RepID=A0A8S9FBS7_BRACR|nr:hypothetical protein F2Q70_00029287 [Brassica cretica]